MRNGDAFTARAADCTDAVALRVDAPCAEISPEPCGRDGRMSLPRELTDFVQVLPRIFLSLEPLDALCFGFLYLFCHVFTPKRKNPHAV